MSVPPFEITFKLMSDWDEDDSDGGWDEDEFTEVVPCPKCGADIYEDAEQCPLCGEYVTTETRVWTGKPIWWVLLGLAGILAVIVLLAGIG